MKKSVIIGAGPVGCYMGYLLAKEGHSVEIYEEHKNVGEPIQCTGLLTNSIDKITSLPESVIQNKINKIRVNSPNGDSVMLKLKKKELVVNRTLFDQFFAKKAKKEGVKLFINHRFLKITKEGLIVLNLKNKKEKVVEYNYLIGADGPNSEVRKIINKKGVKYYIGVQSIIKFKGEKEIYNTYFGKNFPNFFGWIVPISDENAKIGLAAKTKARIVFDDFLKRQNEKELKKEGGLIPIYNPNLTIKRKSILIVGDAATHVKATTGGGIIQGMLAAKELVGIIKKDNGHEIKNKNLKIHRQLLLHLIIRKIMNKFSDEDYNELIRLCKQKKVKRILEKDSRDYPVNTTIKLVIIEPRLLRFLKHII